MPPPCREGGIIKWWCPSVCRVPQPNSRMERPRKPKIGRMGANHKSNQWTYLSGQKVKVARSHDACDRCWPISREWKLKCPRNTKICRKVVHLTGNNVHQFQGQLLKVKVTRSTNAEIGSVSYLLNEKVYKLENWDTDGVERPISPTRLKV